ncbi:DUF1080 domain-containing protein [Sphingobacterium alkalisoli]|uniref:DUF1080 domain-containing protein n=1 Tax=Sphingobacterium alkalisoli TaxID=1874115 RepID=A0A4U0H551_9SPHI|nr:DUF1080 domain-containing protein [Sphingobacterium alkalisoli]TJY66835.1 DUF1080 domain-containing protein [Sphingobacterium alkalisoli]GGH13944.1 large, multifunctional secreted protein [Sphingobacterium alkalisoli]
MRNKSYFLTVVLTGLSLYGNGQTKFQPQDTEFYEPKIRTVTTSDNQAPSDAIVLFNGTGLSLWCSANDSTKEANWHIENKILQVKPGTGNIRTKENFEDFQLHIEWKSPEAIKGEGQGRGNSGVFLQGYYEIQVLDNNKNPTYVNGQAGSLYKQQPPLVSAVKNPGEWHSYDMIYTAPRYNRDGIRIRKGSITVIHNGVVVQYNTEIAGTTEYIGMPRVIPHGAGPIVLQDHGDLVQFRNIWLRKL